MFQNHCIGIASRFFFYTCSLCVEADRTWPTDSWSACRRRACRTLLLGNDNRTWQARHFSESVTETTAAKPKPGSVTVNREGGGPLTNCSKLHSQLWIGPHLSRDGRREERWMGWHHFSKSSSLQYNRKEYYINCLKGFINHIHFPLSTANHTTPSQSGQFYARYVFLALRWKTIAKHLWRLLWLGLLKGGPTSHCERGSKSAIVAATKDGLQLFSDDIRNLGPPSSAATTYVYQPADATWNDI